ncbi:MAG: SUMF1/EgtB/PvdO family nonheme iron enzyme [Rikenellaceae bacterium]
MKRNFLIVSLAFASLTMANSAFASDNAEPGIAQAVQLTPIQRQYNGQINKTANYVNVLKKSDTYSAKLEALRSAEANEQNIAALQAIIEEVKPIISAQNIVDYFNMRAMEEAVASLVTKPGVNVQEVNEKYAAFKALVAKGFDGIYDKEESAYCDVQKALKLKREILLANPAVDVDTFMSVKANLATAQSRDAGAGSLGIQANNWSNITSAKKSGNDIELIRFSGLKSGELEYESIYSPTLEGVTITDLKLHWDADRMLFTSMRGDELLKKFQVFEIDLETNSVREAIDNDEPDLDFFDGAYLPDGRIIAVSNLGYHGVPCVSGADQVGNMILFNPEDKSMRRITFDQEANWHPTVMANGKVMYVRWEYADLTHYFSRIVMHMNPDGTEQKSLYGSGSLFPNSIFDVQPLPEVTNRFVGVISGHHGTVRSGRMVTFDPAKSRKEEKGMLQEYPHRDREIIPIIKDQMVDGVWPQFLKPQPLDDNTFLVTAKMSVGSLWGLYLIDSYDNMTLLYESEDAGFIYSIPVKKTTTPPVIPDKVQLDKKEANVFIQDIYEGEGLPGVKRGEVKALRVFAYEYAYLNTPSNHYVQGVQSGWDIKRLIGTVPVEEDGSVSFVIPANTPISLQPLDSEGRAIQWMRSWLTGMPGETVSCVGCHEDQNTIPVPKSSLASKKAPQQIDIAEGGVHSITFPLDVQPILDRACIACHDGSKESMPNFKDTSLSVPNFQNGVFSYMKSYLAFHPYVSRQGAEADMYVMTPYEYHATNSEVIRLLSRGHHGVELTDSEWKSLYTWIDLNAPYYGRFNAYEHEGYDQIARRIELNNLYGTGSGVDWRAELDNYASYLESKGEIVTVKPEPVQAPTYKAASQKGWPMTDSDLKEAVSKEGLEKKVVKIADGVEITFVRIPAGKFIMGSNDSPISAPEFKASVDKAFWMSETEITNEQYNVIFPEHDSRIYAQFWKDHVNPGYPANEPQQPVVRISREQAAEFANAIAEKSNLKVLLPTETQWEWAARGGKDTDFWYGTKGDDFGKYANLADVSLEKMAVAGVDPKPMGKSHPWFEYYNFIPKIETVDDGSMLPVAVGQYEPNQFGLYDIIGNVWEWTRSDFMAYPLSSKSKVDGEAMAVARGGAYIDRPKDATVSSRRDYLPWQKVSCVGFRLVIED